MILQMNGQEDVHLQRANFSSIIRIGMNLHRCIPRNPTCYSLTLGHQHLTNIYPVEITVQRFLLREAVNKVEMQVKGTATHCSSLFQKTFSKCCALFYNTFQAFCAFQACPVTSLFNKSETLF